MQILPITPLILEDHFYIRSIVTFLPARFLVSA